jgi:ATP-binding cassette subfamily B protein
MSKHTGHTVGLVWGDMPASAFIQNSYIFKSLDENGLRMLMLAGKIYAFKEGEVLMREGEDGDLFYIVKSGKVTVFMTKDGCEAPINTLGRGACIGEVAVLTGTRRTASVRALEPVTAVGISREDIQSLAATYPKVREILQKLIESRAKQMIEKTCG